MAFEIKAVSLLGETFGHPMHVCLRGAKELMRILDKRYKIGIDMKKLEKDIKGLESEIKPMAMQQQELLDPDKTIHKDTSYIG